MIVLYIFIYGMKQLSFLLFARHLIVILGVASNLERKSRENARKMSSLVGRAGNKNVE
jgi:hypothetical protein